MPDGSSRAAFDFSDSVDRQVNLSVFSSPDVLSTFIFGPEREAPAAPAPDVARASTSTTDLVCPAPSAAAAAALSMESSVEEGALPTCAAPPATAAAGRFSALQKWLRRDGSVPAAAASVPSVVKDSPNPSSPRYSPNARQHE